MLDISKRCTRCKRDLPTTAFHRDKSSRDGLTSACKTCRSRGIHRWYTLNRNKVLARQRQRRVTRRDQQRRADRLRRIAEQTRRLEDAGVEQLRLDPEAPP